MAKGFKNNVKNEFDEEMINISFEEQLELVHHIQFLAQELRSVHKTLDGKLVGNKYEDIAEKLINYIEKAQKYVKSARTIVKFLLKCPLPPQLLLGLKELDTLLATADKAMTAADAALRAAEKLEKLLRKYLPEIENYLEKIHEKLKKYIDDPEISKWKREAFKLEDKGILKLQEWVKALDKELNDDPTTPLPTAAPRPTLSSALKILKETN